MQHTQMTLDTVAEEISSLSGLTCDAEFSKISIKIKKQLPILTGILSYTSYSRCSDDIHIKKLLVFGNLILIGVLF